MSLTRLKVWVIGEHTTLTGEACHAGRSQTGQLSAGSFWTSVCFPETGVTCQPSGHSTLTQAHLPITWAEAQMCWAVEKAGHMYTGMGRMPVEKDDEEAEMEVMEEQR